MIRRLVVAGVVVAVGVACALVYWPRLVETPQEFKFEPSYYTNPEAVQDADRRKMS